MKKWDGSGGVSIVQAMSPTEKSYQILTTVYHRQAIERDWRER